MTNRPKQKGTKAERAVANALVRLGFPGADRGAQKGNKDEGDVLGIDRICIEVKDALSWATPEWMRQTAIETVNKKAEFGILVIKAPGIGLPNAEKWLTVMELGAAIDLRHAAAGGNGDRPLRVVKMLKAKGLKGSGYLELVQRERACAPTPVAVQVPGRKMPTKTPEGIIIPYPPDLPPPWYDLMRLDARCQLLLDAGYR